MNRPERTSGERMSRGIVEQKSNTYYSLAGGSHPTTSFRLKKLNNLDHTSRMRSQSTTAGKAVEKSPNDKEVLNNKRSSKGFSFTHSDRLPSSKGNNVLGPGSYTYEPADTRNISYTFQENHHPLFSSTNPLNGPGKYELPSMSHTGTYYYSKFNNSRCSKIGHERRFNDLFKLHVPGPGSYKGDELISLNGNGSYSLAKHRNSLVRTFSRSARMGNASGRDVPGPGSYYVAGSFGLA